MSKFSNDSYFVTSTMKKMVYILLKFTEILRRNLHRKFLHNIDRDLTDMYGWDLLWSYNIGQYTELAAL